MLQEHVVEGELKAVELVLRCMYKASMTAKEVLSLSKGPCNRMLIKAMTLADRFQVPSHIISNISGALFLSMVLKPDIMDMDLLQEVYNCPPAILEADYFLSVRGKCSEFVLSLFGNVPAALSDAPQLKQFCTLPYQAVLAWLSEDDLEVHSENCVLLLLSRWVKCNKTKCSAQQLQELAHHVRVSHLSPSYLHSVLPKLSWFKCSGMKHLSSLIIHQATVDMQTKLDWNGPPAWIKDARKRAKAPIPAVELSIDLDQQQLNELDAGKRLQCPKTGYLNGWYFRVSVKSEKDSAVKGKVTLGMYLESCMKELFGDDLVDMIVTCKYELLYMKPSSQAFTSRATICCQFEELGWGYEDILNASGTSIKELASPFLVDGKLRLMAKVLQVK